MTAGTLTIEGLNVEGGQCTFSAAMPVSAALLVSRLVPLIPYPVRIAATRIATMASCAARMGERLAVGRRAEPERAVLLP